MRIYNFEQNFISNQKGTDKINSISENLTIIKVSFDFYWVSDIQGVLVYMHFRDDIGVRLMERVR